MLIKQLFESNDDDHKDALHKTGFWGTAGAGCLFLSRSSGRFLLAHRSVHVEQPETWGLFGGAIDAGENPAKAALREVREETGYSGEVEMLPLFLFKKATFQYSNFLAVIPEEFIPALNWENDSFKWCEFGKWPEPLHFGVKALLADTYSVEVMQKFSI